MIALESFILIEIEHGISADPFAVHLLPTILDAFPPTPTLRHLSLAIEYYSSLEYIIRLLPHPTLNLLAKLDFPCLPRWTPVSETTIVVLMAEACQQRGIEWSMGGLKMDLLRANSIATSEEDLCRSLQRAL
ncbi:hypothetical protein RQP46_004356 [Phenoliferia psychrophenolica]